MATPRATVRRRVEWYLGPDLEIMPEDLERYGNEPGWVMEPKVDGMWAMLHVGGGPEGQNLLKSRDAATPPLSGSNAADFPLLELGLPEGTILVGELEAATQWAKDVVNKQGYRRFHLFDIPRLGRDDHRALTWRNRREILRATRDSIFESVRARFPLVTAIYSAPKTGGKKFRSKYEEWIEKGYEGCVIKRTNSLYRTGRADGKTDLWHRCKKHVTEDYVFMGVKLTPGGKFSKPKPTGLWGLFTDGGGPKARLVEVLTATCPPEFLAKPEKYVGKLVAEFKGWERFKSGSIRHAQFVRVRKDKQPWDCVLR